MSRIHAELSARFQQWERRGRGWQVHPHPVSPEPPFTPFPGHFVRNAPIIDDGRRPTALSSFFASLWAKPLPPPPAEEEDKPEVISLRRLRVVELPLFLPTSFHPKPQEFEAFFRSLALCSEPITFELIGTHSHVTTQLTAGAADEAQVRQQLKAFFPEVVCVPTDHVLKKAWAESGNVVGTVDFALGEECMLPLASVSHDLCVPLVGAMSELAPDEMAVYQVLFQPVANPWADHLVRSVSGPGGKAMFINAPELTSAAQAKAQRPLFGVVVRVMVCAGGYDRVTQILKALASPLRAFHHPNGNELIPLRNDDYELDQHCEDVLTRESHRSGMLLNADELFGFIRFPTSAVRSEKFRRQTKKTKPAPAIVTVEEGLLLGRNEHAGEVRQVRLTADRRTRHTHLLGASGTGKSTLLFNLIRQDIENGEGVGVLDPHGDLIDRLLGIIPAERLADVVVLDPADEQYVVGFNLLNAHSDWEKNLLASDLVSVFRRLSTSWGDQMGSVLQNAFLAFLESERGGTLTDLRRFLLDQKFREKFLLTVRDPEVVYYWKKGFTQLTGNKSLGPILTRLETFLSPRPIRYMIAQRDSRLDFGDIMDSGKIFLAKLSQGSLGKENSHLLGSLLVAKFQQSAMARQRMAESERQDFWLYLDEFQDFMTPSMAEILSGARKYRLGLTLAHQELRQMQRDPDVASAVMSNAHTRICFRVGDADARTLENGFSFFEARDLQNLSTGEAVCRVERGDFDFNLEVVRPEEPDPDEAAERRDEAITASRGRYATPRAEVEEAIRVQAEEDVEEEKPKTAKKADKRQKSPASDPADDETESVTKPLPKPSATPKTTSVTKDQPVVTQAVTTPEPAPEEKMEPVTPEPLPVPKLVPPPASKNSEPQQPLPPSAGRGGQQHKNLQKRLKKVAEELGYQALLEHPVLDKKGSVDLLLVKASIRIACEISFTTTIDHEVGNVTKCLQAGFSQVAVVCTERARLSQIETAVKGCLDPAEAVRISYFLPTELIEHLKQQVATVPPPTPTTPEVTTRRGYKIKRVGPDLTPEEAKAREEATHKIIAEAMRRKSD